MAETRAAPSESPVVSAVWSNADSKAHRALRDIVQGARMYPLWLTAGTHDLKRQYRRSLLGPLWITISLGVFVAVLGHFYSQFMGVPKARYVPHLAIGFIFWTFIQDVIIQSCNLFVKNSNWILNLPLPYSAFVYQLIWHQVLVFVHNLGVVAVVVILFPMEIGWPVLTVVPAIALYIVNGVAIGFAMGILCVRFRDIANMVNTLMRLAFFATPIIWIADQLGTRAYYAHFNPFASFIEIARAPLMGSAPSEWAWAVVGGSTVISVVAAVAVMVYMRPKLSYWL